jgi:hypothetical protein
MSGCTGILPGKSVPGVVVVASVSIPKGKIPTAFLLEKLM